MNEDDVQPTVGGGPTRRPGHDLCAARERAGIARKDLAVTLHLPLDQVDAIEADDYARLPPPAYVRGYLRAYAREVGLDADQVVADYDAVSGEDHDPELSPAHIGPSDPAAGQGPFLALLVVIVVAAIGIGAWWLQQPAMTPVTSTSGTAGEPVGASEAEPVGSEPSTGAAEAPATAMQEQPAADESAEPTAPEAPEALETTDSAGTADATDTQDEAMDGATAGSAEPAAAATDDDTVANAEPAAGDEQASADDEEQPAAETMVAEGDQPRATSRADQVGTPAAAVGPDRLVIEVDGKSWLEVYDARGRQLAYTLYSGDEPVNLNGWAPFDVFLGNAPDVTLRFGDRAIDHSAFVRSDNTARFQVDSEGAGRR